MNRITQDAKKRQAVVKCAERKSKSFASRQYGVSLSNVKRWCRRYDGKWQSLKERSHRPNSHPARHTAEEEALILLRTPWHNGKAERSHRNGQKYFYDWEEFTNAEDLNEKLKRHPAWSNNKPMRILGGKSPLQMLKSKLRQSAQ